jgi:hypothetical protein
MPFTILFHNWSGIASFEQMKATPAMAQLARSYQPVLLSWELWSTEVFAPGGLLPIAHIVNDSDDGAPLTNAILNYQLVATNGDIVLQSEIPVPAIPYYGTWTRQIPLLLPRTMRSGDYRLVGKVTARGDTVSHNDTSMFIASHKGWDQPAVADRKLVVFDNDHRETHKMAGRLGFRISRFQPQLSVPKSLDDLLIIGENVWRSPVNPETLQSLKEFVDRGGRILCLRQDPAKFDSSWLPEPISFFSASANAATYPPTTRPFNDGMNINLERPDHPVFRGLDRHLLGLWSDTTGWNQTKPGFPDIYPVTAGFKLTKRDSLARTAILANYDRGLEGIALCEMFSGKGSVICCGFELVAHCGVDPAAARLLANLVRYAASKEVHHGHGSAQWSCRER